jgi:hypothetical protein
LIIRRHTSDIVSMEQLFREGMLRLSGKSDQAVFELTQAMGGGKTHMMRAKTNPEWPWMPGNAGMDTLKAEALKQGRWRQGEDGYIEKGPFPKEKTALNITLQSTGKDSGESLLTLTPPKTWNSAFPPAATNGSSLTTANRRA